MKNLLALLISISFIGLLKAQNYLDKWTYEYTASGNVEINDMLTDSNGNTYVLATEIDGTDTDVLLIKFDYLGSLAWEKSYSYDASSDDVGVKLILDGASKIYFLANVNPAENASSVENGFTIQSYSSTGTISNTYTNVFTGGINLGYVAYDLVYDGSANFYVTISRYTTGGKGVNAQMMRLNSTLTWQATSSSTELDTSDDDIPEKAIMLGSRPFMIIRRGTTTIKMVGYSGAFSSNATTSEARSYSNSAFTFTEIVDVEKEYSNEHLHVLAKHNSGYVLKRWDAYSFDGISGEQTATYASSTYRLSDLSVDDNSLETNIYLVGSKYQATNSHYEMMLKIISRTTYSSVSENLLNVNHLAYSSHAQSVYENGSNLILGGSVVWDDPNDGSPNANIYIGTATFSKTGTELDVSPYGSANGLTMDNFVITSDDSQVLAGNLTNRIYLYALCQPPAVNLGSDIVEPYNPGGNNIQLDAGAGYSTYLWSTGTQTRLITVNESGTYSVTVTNAAGCEGTDAVTVTLNPIDQSITWGQIIPTLQYKGDNLTLLANASSGLDVSFSSSNNSIAEAINNAGTWELVIKTPGTVTVTASQSGDAQYNEAIPVQRDIFIDYAKYYWVGNGGTYTDHTNHWATTSGGSTFHTAEPDQYCDVFFTGSSFNTASQVVSGTNVKCHDFSASSIYQGTAFNFDRLDVYGSFDFGSSATYQIYTLGFASNASETVDFYGAVIDAGSLTENWVFYGNGTFEFASDVTFSANFIDVNNSADLVIGMGVTFTTSRPITLSSGTSLTNNGALIFESGANFINQPGSSFSGNDFTFRRNTTFDTSTGKYSIVGSPITNASTSTLGNLVYSYDESVDFGTNDGLDRFVEVTTPETMTPGSGYFSAYTGTIEVTGTPNTGTIDVSLDYSTSTDLEGDYDGFNLVSNPYPAGLSFQDFIDANGPNGSNAITAVIYLWVDGGSDAARRTSSDYMTVNFIGSIGGNTARSSDYNGYLGSFQGFFVQATGTGQTLSFTEDMRFHYGSWDDNFFRKDEEQVFKIRIGLESADSRAETLIGYLGEASADFDPLYDARRFGGNDQLDLASIMDGKHYAIQGRSSFDLEDEIPLYFETAQEGMHHFDFSLEFLPAGFEVYLKDKLTDETIEISNGRIYRFYSKKGAFSDRFVLLRTNTLLATESLQLPFYVTDNTLFISKNEQLSSFIRVCDLSGVIIDEIALEDQSQIDLSYLKRGVFILVSGSQSAKFVIR